MDLVKQFDDLTLTFFGIALVAAMMIARAIGYRLGRTPGEKPDEGVGVLIGSLLSLMSFVLAFNLSTSTTRLEERRSAGLEEATAIGTAWLQARAVGDVQGQAIAANLEIYLSARRSFAAFESDTPESKKAEELTAQLQSSIWSEMTTLLATRPDPQTVSLANALTHSFDMSTAQTFALESGLPPRLLWMLLISSILAIGGLGFYLGLIGKPHLSLSLLLALLWSGSMTLIIDLGMPRVGTINVDLRPYDWTAESFASFRKSN